MKIHFVEVISEGYAYGPAFVTIPELILEDKKINVDKEIQKLEMALKQAAQDVVKHSSYEYFDIQNMMINDPILKKDAAQIIKKEKKNAATALAEALDKYKENLLKSNSKYLQERVYDLEDVKRRIILILLNKKNNFPKTPFVLVCDELMPSIFLENKENILGVVAKKAGMTSHGAILARGAGIPFVVCNNINLKNGEDIIIDTRRKALFEEPEESYILEISHLMNKTTDFEVRKYKNFNLLVNVFDNQEVKKAANLDVDGIGLYRTEFVFMHENRPMTYDEQVKIYKEAITLMNGKPVCFRTFDIGDDKQVAYIKAHHKGFLNYVNNPIIFETQIKALLASNINGNLKIMFPMVETIDEFKYLKNWVLRIKKEMNNDKPILIGMMLETKKALVSIDEFKEVDFISIGTNDLTQELFQIRRDEQSSKITTYVDDLLKVLQKVVDFAKENKIYLSICGELASIPSISKAFMQLGIRNFSVSLSAFRDLNESVCKFNEKKD